MRTNFNKPLSQWKHIFSRSFESIAAGKELLLYENGFRKLGSELFSISDFNKYLDLLVGQVRPFVKTNSVYEIGCGNGLFISSVAKLLPVSQFGGSDFSQVRIDKAKELFPRGKWTCIDACSDSEMSGFVFANSVIQYFPDSNYFSALINKLKENQITAFALLDIPSSKTNDYDFDVRGFNEEVNLQHLRYSPNWIEKVIQNIYKDITVTILPQYKLPYHDGTSRFNLIAKQ
jgi:hypothetical protein